MSVCVFCSDRFASADGCRALLFSPSRLEYTRSRRSLQESADNHCPLCRVLFNFYTEARPKRHVSHRERPDDDILFVFQLLPGYGNLRITQPLNVFAGTLEYKVAIDRDDPLADSVPQRKTETDRGTNNKFSLVKSWIKHCDSEHEICAPPETDLPSRVLDVSSAPASLRLCVSAGGRAPYAALSYCWGTSQPVVTTTDTIFEHLDHISYYSLPATLRDAVKATRSLGIKYLWVDALCIIQDSVEDKEREMALMQQVFQKAYITIVAACAEDSAIGFLRLKPEPDPLFAIPLRSRDGPIGNLLVFTKSREAQREPLHERAWTLQEVFLSPRLIIYGKNQVLWKCLYGERVDSGATDWNGYCASSGLTTIRLSRTGQIIRPRMTTWSAGVSNYRNSRLAETLPEHFRIWKQVVQDYSVRKLTNSADKLPALSGIVTYFQQTMQDRYLAGLWGKHLLHELTWEARDGHRPSSWRAPSWSWMSLDGAISFRADQCEWFEPTAEILHCDTVPAVSSAPFSRLVGGSLEILGYLRPNIPKFLEREYPFARPNEFLFDGKFGEVILDAKDHDDEIVGTSTTDMSPLQATRHGVYWCLMMASCFTFLSENDLTESIWGLALSQKADGTFRRAGYFVGNTGCKAWFEERGEKQTVRLV